MFQYFICNNKIQSINGESPPQPLCTDISLWPQVCRHLLQTSPRQSPQWSVRPQTSTTCHQLSHHPELYQCEEPLRLSRQPRTELELEQDQLPVSQGGDQSSLD